MSFLDELKKLKALRDDGIITKKEYKEHKALILEEDISCSSFNKSEQNPMDYGKSKTSVKKAKNENHKEEEPMIITMEYDDGTEIETVVIGVFEVKGKEYIALVPDDDSDDIYLYGYAELDNDEFELLDIESDKEFDRVVKALEDLMDVAE